LPESELSFHGQLWQRFTHERTASAEDEKLVRAGFEPLATRGNWARVLLQFLLPFTGPQKR